MSSWRDLKKQRDRAAKAKAEAATGKRKALTARDFWRRGVFGVVVGCGTGYMGCFIAEITQFGFRELSLPAVKQAGSSALRSMVAVGAFFSSYQLVKGGMENATGERTKWNAAIAGVLTGIPTVVAFRRLPRGPHLLQQLGISCIGLLVIDQISESKGHDE
jgi:hypothetical protein